MAHDDLRARCVKTTFDLRTVSHAPEVLQDLVRRFDRTLCLNASVRRAGTNGRRRSGASTLARIRDPALHIARRYGHILIWRGRQTVDQSSRHAIQVLIEERDRIVVDDRVRPPDVHET